MAHPPSEPEVKRKHPYKFPHPYKLYLYNEKYVESRTKLLDKAKAWLEEQNYLVYESRRQNLRLIVMVAEFLGGFPKWRKPFHALGKKVPKKALDIEKIPLKEGK